ncbi:MAG TPA: hypothetical protein VFS20_11400, partial [Longimicrobium sp.]|nr:hypothetical protein [Longimicrobium sp.]
MAKAHTLVDNFGDNSLDPAKWYGAYGSPGPLAERIREVNGRIEIRPAPGVSAFNGLESAGYHDLTASEAKVEVVRALNAVPNALTFLRVRKDTNNLVELGIIDGVVECCTVIAGQYTYFGERAYEPEKHRWLRIRESDGTTYWEISGDGCEWAVVGSRANPFAMTVIDFELGCGVNASVSAPGMVIFDNFNAPAATLSRRVEQRRQSARDVRVEAAELAARRPHEEHVNNNDEVNYLTYAGRQLAGLYSKSLKHDALGDPDPFSYDSLLRALQSEDPGDFEEIVLGSSTAVKLTNPQGGLAFDLAGPDAQEITQPPAPRFDSEVSAHEAGELYWMAVARDVAFCNYGTDALIGAAVTSLTSEFPRFGGTVPVTRQNVFRGVFAGEQVGPYVSQFLWKGNNDPRKPDGQGRDANEGFVSYGAQTIDQRIVPQAAGVDYLTDFATWLNVQNGT